MELNTASGEAPSSPQRLAARGAGALAAVLVSQLLLFRGQKGLFARSSFWLPRLLAVASFAWLGLVSAFVPEPYLDEVFHIPQAQKYCEGRFREWDDKITTPPGLYLLTILGPQAARLTGLTGTVACDPMTLRAVNVIGLIVLSHLAYLCRSQIEARLHEEHSFTKLHVRSQYALHTAFNIGLFPLLFFFSGLYYTDVLSTAVVVAALWNHLSRLGRVHNSLLRDVLTIFIGIFALFMRQTNIFWVVIYMGGLEAVHAVKTLRPDRVDQPFMATLSEQLKFYAWRYSLGEVHDVPLHDTWPEDMLFTAVSLVIAAICNPLRVLRQIWPHITVLAAFAAFVSWNGGVVLGDKSNHVATIHLAQMLYIWPLFAFFSLPLLLPYALPVLNILGGIVDALGFMFTRPQPPSPPTSDEAPVGPPRSPSPASAMSKSKGRVVRSGTSRRPSWYERYDTRQSQLSPALKLVSNVLDAKIILWPIYLLTTVIFSVAIVKFNTIIHPFTLADNRHYMFYVFRYTLRRATWIRNILILPYTLSRWMIWGTTAGCSMWFHYGGSDECSASYYRLDTNRATPFTNNPFWINLTDAQQPRGEHLGNPPPQSAEEIAQAKQAMEDKYARDPLAFSVEPIPTSTALIFLIATTLSLITAPLVEPRYFIIPWVVWRLLVPAWRAHDHQPMSVFRGLSRHPRIGWVVRFSQRYDARLILETVWFIVINVVTGYIFLFKPYQWRAEDGTLLDEGRLQRFMW